MNMLQVKTTRMSFTALAIATVLLLAGNWASREEFARAAEQTAVDPFVGHFKSDEGMSVDIASQGGNYAGVIHLNQLEMPLAARLVDGHLEGKFSTGGSDFPFTLQAQGAALSLTTGSNTYILKNTQASAPAPAAAPEAPAAAPAAAGALTIEEIGRALDKYGKNTTNVNGVVSYSLTVNRGKWDINVIVSLSPNHSVIWITNQLASLPDLSKASPIALAKLLRKNVEIGPMFFGMVGPRNSLRISSPVSNHDMTPQALQREVEALVTTVLDTESLWTPDALVANDNPLKK